MIVRWQDKGYGRLRQAVYGAGQASRAAYYRRSLYGPSGYGSAEAELAGGAVATFDDMTHSLKHAVITGLATGIAVHVAIRLIDRLIDQMLGAK